jgi:hypothetical protein
MTAPRRLDEREPAIALEPGEIRLGDLVDQQIFAGLKGGYAGRSLGNGAELDRVKIRRATVFHHFVAPGVILEGIEGDHAVWRASIELDGPRSHRRGRLVARLERVQVFVGHDPEVRSPDL